MAFKKLKNPSAMLVLFLVLCTTLPKKSFSQNILPSPSVVLRLLDSIKNRFDTSVKLLCIDGIGYDKRIDSFAKNTNNMCIAFRTSNPWSDIPCLQSTSNCIYVEVDPLSIYTDRRIAFFSNTGAFMGFSYSVNDQQGWDYDNQTDTLQEMRY